MATAGRVRKRSSPCAMRSRAGRARPSTPAARSVVPSARRRPRGPLRGASGASCGPGSRPLPTSSSTSDRPAPPARVARVRPRPREGRRPAPRRHREQHRARDGERRARHGPARPGRAVPREPLRAVVPVSTRTSEDVAAPGNRVSLWLVPLPLAGRNPAIASPASGASPKTSSAGAQAAGGRVIAEAANLGGRGGDRAGRAPDRLGGHLQPDRDQRAGSVVTALSRGRAALGGLSASAALRAAGHRHRSAQPRWPAARRRHGGLEPRRVRDRLRRAPVGGARRSRRGRRARRAGAVDRGPQGRIVVPSRVAE
jgi:hypothetical protein